MASMKNCFQGLCKSEIATYNHYPELTYCEIEQKISIEHDIDRYTAIASPTALSRRNKVRISWVETSRIPELGHSVFTHVISFRRLGPFALLCAKAPDGLSFQYMGYDI